MEAPRKESTNSKANQEAPRKDSQNQQASRKNSTKQQQKRNKKKEPRKPRYEIPEGWMEEVEKTVTIEFKLPSLPADKDRLQRPNFNQMKNQMTFYEEHIQKHFKKIDALKEEQKKIRNELRAKNSTLYDEMNKLVEERKTHSDVLKANKQSKLALLDEIREIDNKLAQYEKKNSGKVMRKKDLVAMLKQKEDEFKNTMKTSAVEKKMMDEINKLKAQLKGIPGFEKLRVARDKKQDVIREMGKKSKVEFEEVQRINGLIDEIRVRLDENHLKIKKEKEEKEKEDPEKKKRREPTQAEQELEKIKQEHYDEIRKLKESKKKLWEKFDKDYYEFEKQQFEIRRVGLMQKIQKRLRREERDKKWAEEEEKIKLLEEEKAKELLQFKYADEVNLCESLIHLVDDLRPNKKQEQTTKFAQEKPANHNVDQSTLNQENLVYIKPKAKEDYNVVNKKKKRQKKNKKKVVVGDVSEQKMTIHFDTLNLFNEIKVLPPTTYGQIDDCIKQLEEKKNYYIELRNKEIEQAKKAPKEQEGEEIVEEKEEAPVEETQPAPKKEKKKPIKMNEDNFPTL